MKTVVMEMVAEVSNACAKRLADKGININAIQKPFLTLTDGRKERTFKLKRFYIKPEERWEP